MLKNLRIGIIGWGAMAEAIIKGLMKRKLIPASHIIATGKREKRGRELKRRFKIQVSTENAEGVGVVDILHEKGAGRGLLIIPNPRFVMELKNFILKILRRHRLGLVLFIHQLRRKALLPRNLQRIVLDDLAPHDYFCIMEIFTSALSA